MGWGVGVVGWLGGVGREMEWERVWNEEHSDRLLAS